MGEGALKTEGKCVILGELKVENMKDVIILGTLPA
jgi:hypothetical protein